MGRKRKIPLESKTIKYMYFIKVDLKGEDVLKFGISNNVVRRMTEYNDANTVGQLKEVKDVFRCDHPERIETFTKWKMRKYTKPVMSQEYFPIEDYQLSKDIAKSFASDLGYRMKETSLTEIKLEKKIIQQDKLEYKFNKNGGVTPFD